MSKNNEVCPMKKTSIGGQALIEGIMMRGPKKTAMAVRNTRGEIVLEVEDNQKNDKKPSVFTKIPIVRGVVNFILSMKMGYKCLMRSAEISGLEELEEEEKREKALKKAKKTAEKKGISLEEELEIEKLNEKGEKIDSEEMTEEEKAKEKKKNSVLMSVVSVVSVVLSLALALFLFVWLPSMLYEWLSNVVPFFSKENRYLKSVFEGILKVIILVCYMGIVGLQSDIKRTFMYHGAEHKTIFCYESGLPLTVENVKKMQRFHPRCGTSFLIVMVLVGILISFLIPPNIPSILRVCFKLLLLPLIMGLGYEFIKFAGKHDNILVKILSAPGLAFQRMTVYEPTDDMIECAIKAVNEVIPEDGSDIINK